jgi:hypothetical protein
MLIVVTVIIILRKQEKLEIKDCGMRKKKKFVII